MSFALEPANATDEHILKWREAVNREPQNTTSINQLGEGLLQKGRETGEIVWYARAKGAFESALAIDDDWRTLSNLAWVSTVYHDFQHAIEYADKSLEARPDNADAYGILTDSHIELGHYEKAAETCQKMVDIHPSLASYSRAAQVRYYFGNTQGAIEMYKKAIESGAQFPENVTWCRAMLGDLYFKQGALPSAEETYSAVLKTNPTYRLALGGKGRVEASKGNLSKAIDYFERATTGAAPPTFLYELGELYTAAGKTEDANKAFARFTDRLAEYSDAGIGGNEVMWITYWLDRNTELKRAVDLAESEVKQHQSVPTYVVLAWAHSLGGDKKEAETAAEKALRTGVQDPVVFYRLAKVYEQTGNRAKARSLANAALGLNPNFHPLFADEARRMVRTTASAVMR